MKRQRGWGYAALVCVAIMLVGTAIGFALGFRQGQSSPDKYDWTYINGEGYPQEVTAAINYGTTGLLAGAGVAVVYLIAFGAVKKKNSVGDATEPEPEPGG